jgi:NitT/TauT family transport system substrate-binding protein
MTKKVINEISGIVFSLPWIVARDEGFFAEEGLEVEFVRAGERRQRFSSPVLDHELVESIAGHQVFEDGAVELYRACEWGQVRRAHDSDRGGQILSKRSAIGVMGIYTQAGSPLTHPQTLSGKSIAVNFHAGSHYAGIQMLEGFLSRSEINVVHIGGPQQRYEALINGDVDAAALMEPWNTIAEKNGHQKVIETHYAGAEIGAKDLDSETFEALNRAVRKAVQRINADKKSYVHYLIDDLPEEYQSQITPDDFYLPRLRYVDPEPYSQDEFQQTFDWMVDWGLVGREKSYEDLVDNRISVSL